MLGSEPPHSEHDADLGSGTKGTWVVTQRDNPIHNFLSRQEICEMRYDTFPQQRYHRTQAKANMRAFKWKAGLFDEPCIWGNPDSKMWGKKMLLIRAYERIRFGPIKFEIRGVRRDEPVLDR